MKILFLSLLLYASLSFAVEKGDIQVIESTGEAILGDDTTPAQARAMALNNARRSAIEEASGVVVHGSTVVYNYQLISDLVKASTRGLIVKEDILLDEIKKEEKQIVYVTKIKANVKPLESQRDGSLKILKAEVNRYGSGSKGSIFQNGDEIQIKVKTNKESYINIFGISQDGLATKLYPNEYFKAEVISPDTEFIFPDERQRGLGLKLKVRTPKNLSRTVETILIVAAKEIKDFLSDKKADEVTITDIMRELSEIEPSSWIEETIGYEIRK